LQIGGGIKKGIKIGKNEKEILQAIGVGAIVLGTLLIPGLPMALTQLKDSGKAGKQNTKRSIKRLEEKDILYLSGDKIKLTKKGRELLKRIEAEDIVIEKPDKWDNVWHVVAYDIPDDDKPERDYFRTKLEELGFLKVQESIYVFPYDCVQEIAVFAQSLGISPYVLHLTTSKLPRQKEYVKKFDL
jgi:DNA-binding transcriptional regulator PaaX